MHIAQSYLLQCLHDFQKKRRWTRGFCADCGHHLCHDLYEKYHRERVNIFLCCDTCYTGAVSVLFAKNRITPDYTSAIHEVMVSLPCFLSREISKIIKMCEKQKNHSFEHCHATIFQTDAVHSFFVHIFSCNTGTQNKRNTRSIVKKNGIFFRTLKFPSTLCHIFYERCQQFFFRTQKLASVSNTQRY